MSELIATVHVTDADGNDQTFSPGEEVPAWAEKLITNPKAWDEVPSGPSETLAKRGPGRPSKATTTL